MSESKYGTDFESLKHLGDTVFERAAGIAEVGSGMGAPEIRSRLMSLGLRLPRLHRPF